MIKTIVISTLVRTKQEANELISALEEVLDSFFSVKEKPVDTLRRLLSPYTFNQIAAYCKNNTIDMTDKNSLKNLLQDIKETIQHLPIVTLEIPFYPTEDVIQKISKYFATDINKPVLLAFTVKKTLVAGTVILFNGRYRDYSLKKRFDEAIHEQAKGLL
jgi:F0F1-type ATP synthase delta subunit